jgi:hypothetical protein
MVCLPRATRLTCAAILSGTPRSLPSCLQISSGLQLAGLNGATAGTGATLLALVIAHDVITSLAPWSPSFSQQNLEDISKRPQGPPNQTPSSVGGWFGIAELGAFSKVGYVCIRGWVLVKLYRIFSSV